MAIFHLSTKPISRSSGRSSTASAAYRSACEIVDNRTGLKHDYSKKRGVIFSMAVDKNGVDLDRSELWNLAEKSENRKDARTAREWVVAIPAALVTEIRDCENNIKIDSEKGVLAVLDFAYHLANEYNVGVDVAIHAPDTAGDNRNYHAHIMTTTRELSQTENGLALGAKTSLEWSNTKRKNENLGTTTADEIKTIRARWEQIANTHLENAGRDERIDHRSFRERGLNIEPTIKLGWQASAMERNQKSTRQGNINRAITLHNELTILREQKNEQNLREQIGRADDLIRASTGCVDKYEQQSISANNLIRKCVSPTNRAAPNPYTDRARARVGERKYFADELSERAKHFDNETDSYRDRTADAAAALGMEIYPKFIGRQNSQDFDERQKNALNDFAHENDLDSGDVRQQMRNAYTFFENLSISGNEKIINLLCDPAAERSEFEKTGDGIKNQQQQPVPESVQTQAVTVAAPNVAPSYRPRRP